MKLTDLQNLNRDYEFLMGFIGLAEVQNELGLTETSNDQLDMLECAIWNELTNEETQELSKHLEGLKELIDSAMDRM